MSTKGSRSGFGYWFPDQKGWKTNTRITNRNRVFHVSKLTNSQGDRYWGVSISWHHGHLRTKFVEDILRRNAHTLKLLACIFIITDHVECLLPTLHQIILTEEALRTWAKGCVRVQWLMHCASFGPAERKLHTRFLLAGFGVLLKALRLPPVIWARRIVFNAAEALYVFLVRVFLVRMAYPSS